MIEATSPPLPSAIQKNLLSDSDFENEIKIAEKQKQLGRKKKLQVKQRTQTNEED